MNDRTAAPPKVFVRLTPNHRAGIWAIAFACPWCPRKRGKPRRHFHGGGDLGKAPVLGFRSAHCIADGAPECYELVLDPVQPESPVARGRDRRRTRS